MNLLDPDTDLYLFHGRFNKNPEKCQFIIGDRHLIEEPVTFVKTKTHDFWKPSDSGKSTEAVSAVV